MVLIAAAMKLGVLAYAERASGRRTPLRLLVLVLAAQDLLLFLSLQPALVQGAAGEWLLFGRMLARVFAMMLVVAYLLMLAQLHRLYGLIWAYAAFGLGVIGLGLMALSTSGEFFSSIPVGLGNARRVYLTWGLATLIYALWRGCRSAELEIRQRCRATLFTLAPVAALYALHLTLVYAAELPSFDLLLRAAIPLATSIVLGVIVLDEGGQLTPLRIKWAVLLRIARLRGDIDAAALYHCLQQAMVASAMRRSEYNKAEAARLLGLSKSTFHRKAEKYSEDGGAP